MCSRLHGSMGIFRKLSDEGSDELVGIFQYWLETVEDECVQVLGKIPGCPVHELTRQVGISEEAIESILKRIKKKEEEQ